MTGSLDGIAGVQRIPITEPCFGNVRTVEFAIAERVQCPNIVRIDVDLTPGDFRRSRFGTWTSRPAISAAAALVCEQQRTASNPRFSEARSMFLASAVVLPVPGGP